MNKRLQIYSEVFYSFPASILNLIMFKKFQVHISKNETYNESAFSRDDHLPRR